MFRVNEPDLKNIGAAQIANHEYSTFNPDVWGETEDKLDRQVERNDTQSEGQLTEAK